MSESDTQTYRRTKAERLRDLGEDIENEARQPIYSESEVDRIMYAACILDGIADDAELDLSLE